MPNTFINTMLGSENLKADFKTNIKEDSKGLWKADFHTKPTAAFTATGLTGVHGITHTFTSTSTGTFDRYLWNFGDSTTSTLAAPTHVYAAAGTFTVTLTVTGHGGTNTGTRTGYIVLT